MTAAARNRRTGLALAGLVAGMIGLAFASVPLYDLFCRVTGFGGTPVVAAAGDRPVLDRTVKVQFIANLASDLPWRFEPLQGEVTVRLGEERIVWYRATNVSQRPIVGTASYNVTPESAGGWFNKIQCFCFVEQLLMPGQSIDMPVAFFVDPELAKERSADGLRHIVLSYTFFEARTDRARAILDGLSRPAGAGPQAAPGAPAVDRRG